CGLSSSHNRYAIELPRVISLEALEARSKPSSDVRHPPTSAGEKIISLYLILKREESPPLWLCVCPGRKRRAPEGKSTIPSRSAFVKARYRPSTNCTYVYAVSSCCAVRTFLSFRNFARLLLFAYHKMVS